MMHTKIQCEIAIFKASYPIREVETWNANYQEGHTRDSDTSGYGVKHTINRDLA